MTTPQRDAAAALARPAPFHLLLCGTLVLYVYRVFVAGANLSLFRIVLVGWTLATLVQMLRGRLRITGWHAALAALAAGIGVLNAVDFAGLAAHPLLRRDILNHVLNVWFAILLALHVRSHATAVSLLAAFVWSSVLTTAITLASWTLGALPFEGWLRAYAGPAARDLRYLGYDGFFNRATSAFFDPNYYGIYSALVVVVALGLWLTVDRQRWLLWLAGVSVLFLSATLSRTAIAALLGTAVIVGSAVWRGRTARGLVALIAAAAVLCFLAATVLQSRAQRERLAAWLQWEIEVKGRPTPAEFDRLTGSASVADRVRRIRHGWQVFQSAPWLGRGGAALLNPDFPPHASAHVVYLTLLARYGIVGTLVYAAFALVPLAVLAGRRGPPADAVLITAATCLALVFLSYDVFLGFELVYLFVGLAWGLAALPAVGRDTGGLAHGRV